MKKRVFRTTALLVAMLIGNGAFANSFAVSEEVKTKLDPVLTKSGGELHYFEGPAGMVGVGVTFQTGKQMVVYATPDGSTVFSGVAIDVDTGINLTSADMQKLPAPSFDGVLERLTREAADGQRSITTLTEGNPESENHYYVFVDPTCGYCHRTYNNFLKVLAEGGDFAVHYIPVGILGPEAQNLAKEMLSQGGEEGLTILRAMARKEPPQTRGAVAAQGSEAFDGNMSVFRELGFSGVPAVISRVGGKTNVRGGMVTAEAIQQELQLAVVKKVAMAQP